MLRKIQLITFSKFLKGTGAGSFAKDFDYRNRIIEHVFFVPRSYSYYSTTYSSRFPSLYRIDSVGQQRSDRKYIQNSFHIQDCGFHRSQHRLAHETSSSYGSSKSDPPPTPPPLPPPEGKKQKSRNFVFAKFSRFIDGYQAILEKKFPGAMHVYRVFVVGFKEFSKEFATYVKIRGKVLISSQGVKELGRKELELYHRMPKEMFKVGPTLLVSALPFANYIVFPIAYYFPKRLLSSHFWSIQQKSQFAIEAQRRRYYSFRPVFRTLQQYVKLVTDERLQKLCLDALAKLGSGQHPSVEEIMELKPLFESDPFSLKAMYGPHVVGLCRIHGCHSMFFSRSRLYNIAEMLQDMDLTILHDGVQSLKTDELRTVCFLRGLNASNTTQEDMVEYMTQWLSVSTELKPRCYSLLLHLPILLGYNNPNNWALKS